MTTITRSARTAASIKNCVRQFTDDMEALAESFADGWENWGEAQGDSWEDWGEATGDAWEAWGEAQGDAWENWGDNYADAWEAWAENYADEWETWAGKASGRVEEAHRAVPRKVGSMGKSIPTSGTRGSAETRTASVSWENSCGRGHRCSTSGGLEPITAPPYHRRLAIKSAGPPPRRSMKKTYIEKAAAKRLFAYVRGEKVILHGSLFCLLAIARVWRPQAA